MNYYLGLDVGGTNIKSSIIDESGKIMFDTIFTFNAQANFDKDLIINNFILVFKKLTESIIDPDMKIKAIGLAFPGPFDYLNGVSLMKGIGKYDSIYNVNLKEEFLLNIKKDKDLSKLMNDDLKFVFMHDVAAFALGEIFFGNGKDHNRIIHLCIGTGAGSAFSVNSSLVVTGKGVPKNGWIYNTEFKDSIIDNYVSARGLESISLNYFTGKIDGRTLYDLALKQDENSLRVFREFGQNLYEAFTPFINNFNADCVILGGEIVRSFKFFGGMLEQFCQVKNVDIYLSQNTSKSTLLGLYKQLVQSE